VPQLRTGSSDDIADVLALWRVATTEPSSTDDAAGISQLLGHDSEALVLACVDDTIAGTVIVGWDGWRGTMYRLAVMPSHRRRGIATALIAEAERRLKARGARRLHLIVVPGDDTAHEFWRAVGYAPTEQSRFVKNLP
jgi:ribosomal protein S18 acetylase RimI-like enzyme